MKITLYFLILLGFVSCTKTKIETFHFLEGKWKVESKNQFEVWKINTDGKLSGYSYKQIESEKKITETLILFKKNNKIIYQATVPDQNNAASISFVLNDSIHDYYSFENPQHDFPKKIQYQIISSDKILVKVLGENDEGFSIQLIRVK